jgi:hypothetical protein
LLARGFGELVFGGHDQYVHKTGGLSFHKRNCIMFRKGAELIIHKDATLNYGNQGMGMLALLDHGKIVFGENTRLNFNGKLVLHQSDTNHIDHHIYLSEGNNLIFENKSPIMVAHPDNKLIIHNRGGFIDLSGLPVGDRKPVKIIEEDEAASTFSLHGNPVTVDQIKFELFSDLSESVNVRISSLNWSNGVQL